jgi:hypothetical protein
LWRRVHVSDAVLLAFGLALLATSRPYEGMLVAAPVGVLLAVGLVTRRLVPAPVLRFVVPVILLLGAALGALATLNREVTGDPLEFPYRVYDRGHPVQPVFLWEPMSPLAASELSSPPRVGWFGLRAPRTSGWHRLAVVLYFFLGLPGVLAVAITPGAIRDAWSRFATLVFLTVAVGHFLIYPWWPHYSAPALAAILVPAVQGHRLMYVARRGTRRPRAFGPALFAAACGAQLAVFLFQIPSQRADPSDPSRQRARLAWEFEHRPGKHLLLVTYPPGWSGDWTFNSADVDAAKVVWATDLGQERDAEILRYYGDRTAWSIDAAFADVDPVPRLIRPAVVD